MIIISRLLGFFMIMYLINLFRFIINLKEENKSLNKIITVLLISLFINLNISDLLSISGYKSIFFAYLTDFNFILLLTSVLCILVFKSIKKSFISHILIFIWMPLFTIIGFQILNYSYNFIDVVSMEYVGKFLFIYETIFISVIIAYKYNLIEKEKEQLLIESKNKEILYLRQSKLIKMGEMLNNIAHQWKQPLARINSIIFKSYHLVDENKKEDLKKELLLIENETFYMSNTISTLLNFFHIDKKKEIFNLLELANKQKKFVSQFSNIELIINCADEKISTDGYKNEYEQVIQVIIENAIESLIEFKIENPTIIISITIEDNLTLFSRIRTSLHSDILS